MSAIRVTIGALVIAAAGFLQACGADIPPPPDYSWVFDVTVIPASDSECDPGGGAEAVEYVYGLVVEGDHVLLYSDDSLLAEGTLHATYLSYSTPSPFTDHRQNDDGAPMDVEWTLTGTVSFFDQSLNTSEEGEEIITIFYSEDPSLDEGCTHRSNTEWKRRTDEGEEASSGQ